MREILFRGKCKENTLFERKWVYGYLSNAHCIYTMEDECENLIDERTVCQYTGLTDKNGRKIFEGDIVKTGQYGVDNGNGHNYAGFDTFYVEFSDGSFCLKNKWRRFNLRPQRDFEVIGNIFDGGFDGKGTEKN